MIADEREADGALPARVWDAMRAVVLDRHDRRAEVCAALGMSFFRVGVLRVLVRKPMTMGALADRLGSDPPYLTIVVTDLERRGLVRRARDPADRRRKIVSLTAAGAEAAGVAESLLGAPPAGLAALPVAELRHLARVLESLRPL